MSTLERWSPFKFRRKKAEEKKAERVPDASADTSAMAPMSSWFGMPMGQLMQRMFDESFIRDPFARLGNLDSWFGDFSPRQFQPKVDVVDEEGTLKVTAELPGMARDDVQLSIDNDILTIRGEKKNQEERKENGAFRTERFYGYVQRSVPLPTNLDPTKAEANFDKGVLTVRIPASKKAEERGRKIPINT